MDEERSEEGRDTGDWEARPVLHAYCKRIGDIAALALAPPPVAPPSQSVVVDVIASPTRLQAEALLWLHHFPPLLGL
jgi:hypothetical protein